MSVFEKYPIVATIAFSFVFITPHYSESGQSDPPPETKDEHVDYTCSFSTQVQSPNPCNRQAQACDGCADSTQPGWPFACTTVYRYVYTNKSYSEVIGVPPGTGLPVATWDDLCYYERECNSSLYDFKSCQTPSGTGAQPYCRDSSQGFPICRSCIAGLYTQWGYYQNAEVFPCSQ